MPQRLLLVEDDAAVRRSLEETLRETGYDVSVAENAENALGRLAEARPEVVLTDVRMPGMDGISLLRILRERAPGTDVIVMTAFDDMPTVVSAMREGAFELLVKPLRLADVRDVIARVFEDRRTREAAQRADFLRFQVAEIESAVSNAKKAGIEIVHGFFVVGNPGSTGRLNTIAQLEFLRDYQYPFQLDMFARQIAAYQELSALSPERAAALRNPLFSAQNSQKAIGGYQSGLLDPSLMERKRAWETAFRAKVEAENRCRRKTAPG